MGSFDSDTDLQALPNTDRYRTVSVSSALPRTFPRFLQCLRLACFHDEIITACFAWLGSATTVQEIELQFHWSHLHWQIPDFPSLMHARELHTLRIVQLF